MHWEILDPIRQKLLPKLVVAKAYGFYLAGGTALALQLGHRTSVDFDFYAPKKFDEMRFETDLVQQLNGFKVTQRSSGTLIGQVQRVDLSFFYYPYPLLEPLIATESLNLVSVADLAAMKLIAISQRGVRRDFLDLYVIAKDRGLSSVFDWTREKFPQFDPYVCLKALTYFEDADRDESGRGMQLKEDIAWPKIKVFFEQQAKTLARKWL